METHFAPLGTVIWLSLMSEHLVHLLRVPAAAQFPDDCNARTIHSCIISVFRSDGVVPLEYVVLCCPDDDRPTFTDPLPRLDGSAIPGENVPEVVRLLDGRFARLSFLAAQFTHLDALMNTQPTFLHASPLCENDIILTF